MKKMFYVLLALLVSMVLVFGVSCDNSNKAPGGAEGNPPVEEPGTDVPGGDEENPDIDDPSTDEPPVESFSPSWAVGKYNATVLDNPASANITDDNFSIQLSYMNLPISISSNGEGVTVSKNEKNDAEKTWTIVLSGISIAMGADVTVTLTSVTDNQELSVKVERSFYMFILFTEGIHKGKRQSGALL